MFQGAGVTGPSAPAMGVHAFTSVRWTSVAAAVLFSVSVAQAQEQNAAVLDHWADQTGEQVELSHGDNGAVTWRVNTSVDIYRRSVTASGEEQQLTPYTSGNFHNASASGEWQSESPDGEASHVYFADSHTSDPSVQSRFRNQINTLQLGLSSPTHRLAAGDVVANFSMLGASTGLRGASAQWQGQSLGLEAFGGVVSDSWETLLGARPFSGAQEVPVRKRNVYGLKFSHPLSERVSAFATIQTFDDRRSDAVEHATNISGDAYTDSLPEPAYNAHSRTIGLAYQRSFDGGQSLGIDVERGWSDGDIAALGERTSANAHSLNIRAAIPWSEGHQYTLGLGHHDLGLHWQGLGAAALPGTREIYVTNGLQWNNGISWFHDWRNGMDRQVWGDGIYAAKLITSTHQLGWQPEWMEGGALALHDIRSRSSDNAGGASSAHKTQASVSLVSGGWQASVQWGLAGQTVNASTGEKQRVRDWQVSAGHSAQDLPRNPLGVSSYSASVFAGRKTHLSSAQGRLVVRSVGLDVSSFSPTWGSLSLSHSRQWVDLVVGGQSVPSRNTSLNYIKDLSSGLSLRVYASHLDQNPGLAYAQLSEKLVGVQLSKTFP